MGLPDEVHRMLRTASTTRLASVPEFKSHVFDSAWDSFVEEWAPRIYIFVANALGPYGTQPLPDIIKMSDGMHSAGATASFDMRTGQVTLSDSTEGKPGQILEKLTHEFTHGSLSQFPDGDMFYEEGYVDYSVWVMAHAPIWGQYRSQMINAAEFNIRMRRTKGLKAISDYDNKRWAGGLHCSYAYGPLIIARMRQRKAENNFTW